MKPIVLTEIGETLLEYPGSTRGDDGTISSCIGVHGFCNGWMDIYKISATHSAITCRQCKLRVIIPSEVDTYGKLRSHLARSNPL